MKKTKKYRLRGEKAASIVAKEPKGLGGGLILVHAYLFGTLWGVMSGLVIHLTILAVGQWNVLTTPGSESYHPLWAPLILFKIGGNLVGATLVGYLLHLFFKKSRRFPRFFIVCMMAKIVFLITGYFVADLIPAAADSDKGLWQISFTIIGASVCIPYILRSKRVKNTFVR
ncbi:MAG: DUF2569 domain-containing protein [Betaproteobacteria bacterium]|nr:DUF2569 domain-containing protein [Betaproteobacteria bacterium]